MSNGNFCQTSDLRRQRLRPVVILLLVVFQAGCWNNRGGEKTATISSSDSAGTKAVPDDLRILGTLPGFTLQNQSGNDVQLTDFCGKVWIANFIFTRCLATCPRQTAALTRLQDQLERHAGWDDIRLVSFTVDPEFDTPEILAAYAQQHRADLEHWSFLTGPRSDIWNLSKEGFKLPVGERPNSNDMPILHSPHFILVDRAAHIRGYFDSGDDSELKRLTASLSMVLDEPYSATRRDEVSHSPFPYPDDVMAPKWLEERKQKQLAAVDSSDVFRGFQFVDKADQSGITFEHSSVEYACKVNIATHYDHGNGIAIADIDGDNLLDVYFSTQIGANQLWKNLGSGKFQNVTTPAIELADPVGVTASLADSDNDGDPDLYVTSIRGGNYFFENDGQGRFVDQTVHSGLGYNGHSSSGVFFDYDRDGLVDLFLCNVGVFTQDEVDSQGIHVPLNDAFAGHLKPAQRNERSILYKNLGGNRFADVSEQTGLVDHSWTGDASPLDANDDGWPDLYVLNMQGHDEYYQNVDGKRFEKKSREIFPKTSWGAMGIKVFDFDNDGKSDIYITDMHSDMSAPIELNDENAKSKMVWPESFLRSGNQSIFGNSFFHNQGNGRFAEISDKIGAENYWPWGLSVGDLNADGFDDVFVSASMNYPFRYCVNKLLVNDRGKRFLESEFVLGIEPRKGGRTAKANFRLDPAGEDREHQLVKQFNLRKPVEVWGALGTRSSAIFDLDNDGDLDIITNEFNDRPMVLVSNLTDKKPIHWLKVKLTGKKSNSAGLGGIVQVHANNTVYTKVHDGLSGYLSHSVFPLYFGLGEAAIVEKVVVKWPMGNEQTVTGPLEANRTLEIVED